MRKSQAVGLVAGGSVSRSGIGRLPQLLDHIGPVKAASLRLASRVTGLLRAGYPVRHYQELQACKGLILCVPTASIDKVVNDLSRTGWNWRRKPVILWHETFDSSRLAKLSELGAPTASACPLPGVAGNALLVEGDPVALRALREWTPDREIPFTEVAPGKKTLYQAGISLANLQVTLLAGACVECLHEAGIPLHEAQRIGEAEFSRSLRAFFKAGRRGWRNLNLEERRAIEHQWDKLADRFPALALRYGRAWQTEPAPEIGAEPRRVEPHRIRKGLVTS